jgi:sugar-specific transcriptional regulator TrmB
MNINKSLQEIGLTGNESKVYEKLLKTGLVSANELSKKISMDRTLTYQILNNLIEKGLVKFVKKDNKKFFEATSPENLLNPIKEKEALAEDLIPLLNNIKTTKSTSFEVNLYEGREGLKAFMKELLKHKDACGFGGTGRAYNEFYESPRWVKEFEKKKIKFRLIVPQEFKGHIMEKAKFMNIKYLNLKSEATTTIVGDMVSIHLIKEKPHIVVIKNKEIAESYRNHFEVLWKQAKK